jgi:hypothetical protein
MAMPAFTGESSLYKTAQLYRGNTGLNFGPSVIAAQTSCTDSCWQQYGACAGLCLLSFNPAAIAACEAGCWIKNLICQASCPTPGGGGPPPPPECCPPGARCCGSCVAVPGGGQRCIGGPCVHPPATCG